MHGDLETARACQASLKQIIERHAGEAGDYRALRRVLELCRRAGGAVDDEYCREKLRQVEEFSAVLLAPGEQRRWQFLKDQILGALELYYSRLYSLEALRRAAARASLNNLQPLST